MYQFSIGASYHLQSGVYSILWIDGSHVTISVKNTNDFWTAIVIPDSSGLTDSGSNFIARLRVLPPQSETTWTWTYDQSQYVYKKISLDPTGSFYTAFVINIVDMVLQGASGLDLPKILDRVIPQVQAILDAFQRSKAFVNATNACVGGGTADECLHSLSELYTEVADPLITNIQAIAAYAGVTVSIDAVEHALGVLSALQVAIKLAKIIEAVADHHMAGTVLYFSKPYIDPNQTPVPTSISTSPGGSTGDGIQIVSISSPTVSPGAQFVPEVVIRRTAGVLDPARGDLLDSIPESDTNKFQAYPIQAIKQFVNTGGTYTFNDPSGFKMTAPNSPGTYTSHWKMRISGSFVGPDITIAFTVAANSQPACDIGSHQVALFAADNYNGWCHVFGIGQVNDLAPFGLSANVTSLKVAPDVTLFVNSETNRSGNPGILETNHDLTGNYWNDRIKSISAERKNDTSCNVDQTTANGFLLIREGGFRLNGGCLLVTSDQNDLDPLTWNNFTGIKVLGTYRLHKEIIMYKDAGYGRECGRFFTDQSWLVGDCANSVDALRIIDFTPPQQATDLAPLATRDHTGSGAAVDGDLNTEWAVNDKGLLGIVFNSPRTIQDVVVFDRTGNSTHGSIDLMDIVFSDGTRIVNADVSPLGMRCVDVSFAPKTVTWVNLVPTDASTDVGYREVQIFQADGTPWSLNNCPNKYTLTPVSGIGLDPVPIGQETPASCVPGNFQVALFTQRNYAGQCSVLGVGDYPTPASTGIPNDSLWSLKLGPGANATLWWDDNFGGSSHLFTSDAPDLQTTGDNQIMSSFKVIAIALPSATPSPTVPPTATASATPRQISTSVPTATPKPVSSPTVNPIPSPRPNSAELLTTSRHLTGNNGAAEFYQAIDPHALDGKTTVRITYDLHGLHALGGDASAVIIDQGGWKYISLSDYGQNGLNGSQTVDVPLTAFGLNASQPNDGTLHMRFWYSGVFTVDITSVQVLGTAPPSPTPTSVSPTSSPTSTPSATSKPTSTSTPTASPTPKPTSSPTAAPVGRELLTNGPWHLTPNNGAAELYQPISAHALDGMTTACVTYDLHGLTALPGDASAIIFDQGGWKFISLSNYGKNGFNGSQTVCIPLSAFGLDLSKPIDGTIHTRFWYSSAATIDISSITVR